MTVSERDRIMILMAMTPEDAVRSQNLNTFDRWSEKIETRDRDGQAVTILIVTPKLANSLGDEGLTQLFDSSRNGNLIVLAHPDVMRQVKAIIRKLDIAPSNISLHNLAEFAQVEMPPIRRRLLDNLHQQARTLAGQV